MTTTPNQYIALLGTYSPYLKLDALSRSALFTGLKQCLVEQGVRFRRYPALAHRFSPPPSGQPQRPLSTWLLAAAAAVVLALAWLTTTPIGSQLTAWLTPASAAGDQAIASAFVAQRNGVQVASDGVVDRVLPDDNAGSRHQRFILRLDSGHQVLVAHNIDPAPRLRALKPGDDPNGCHRAGWLTHNGQRVQ